MKRAESKSRNPHATLQSFLESSSAEVRNRFEIRSSIVENVLRLATAFVDSINKDSHHLEECCGRLSSVQIFEAIRTQVIRLIARNADNSVDFAEFVEAYEFLLEQRLSGSAGCFRLVSSQTEKRKRGVFYTPDDLARDLTLNAMRPLISTDNQSVVDKILSLKIVDPAMGAGSFLFMALEILTDCILEKLKDDRDASQWTALFNHIASSTDFPGEPAKLRTLDSDELKVLVLRTVASKCLYGLDVDDAAVELVRIGMLKRCGLPSSADGFPNLRRGNALVGLWQKPNETVLSNALKMVSERVRGASVIQNIDSRALSDKVCRDLVCSQ
ncbi:MAG: hypothetical protein C0469_03920, partial [Cyanobacteria bacterium DS2.3.42]|nr:hypothetical protein [Cyanobacteria bacterium DS2.3.42]